MGKKILVVDDDHLVVKTIGKLLENEGYAVITSESGAEALNVLEKENVDLVISDIRMPGMNGVETIKVMNDHFKENKKKAPPFIFITGFAEESINDSAKKMNPSEFLYKPFNKDEFVNAIKLALEV